MENNLIIEITKNLEDVLTIKQTESLKLILVKCFSKYDILLKEKEKQQDNVENNILTEKFLAAKKIERC